jgi:hypothetical protein
VRVVKSCGGCALRGLVRATDACSCARHGAHPTALLCPAPTHTHTPVTTHHNYPHSHYTLSINTRCTHTHTHRTADAIIKIGRRGASPALITAIQNAWRTTEVVKLRIHDDKVG